MSHRVSGALLAALLFSQPLAAAIPSTERAALIALYDGTNGAAWTNHTGWKGTIGTECGWLGVTCNGAGTSVLRVELPQNNLSGTLPTTLGNLPNLVVLTLNSNDLSGPLPASLGTLAKLKQLAVGVNRLSGPIPTQLGNASALETLLLRDNEFTGPVPSELGFLPELVQLRISNNRLSGSIPGSLGNLSVLKSLWLQGNQLSGPVPASFSNLVNIDSASGGLDLRYNALTVSDPALLAFLNAKQAGANFPVTQTVPPQNLVVSGRTPTSVTIGWTIVGYQSDPGNYEVLVAPTAAGPFTPAAATNSKLDRSVTLSGLAPATTRYAVVRTLTAAGIRNKNQVTSLLSPPIAAATLPAGSAGLAMDPAAQVIVKGSAGRLTLSRPGDPAVAPLSVALASSDPSIATVPASATIPVGAISAVVSVTTLAAGKTTITATAGPASVAATVGVVPACPEPDAPFLRPLPPAVVAGRSFLVAWSPIGSPIAGNLSYAVDASDDAAFSAGATRTTNTRYSSTLVKALPEWAGKTLYVRVRSLQRCGTSVIASANSASGQTHVDPAAADFRLLRTGVSFTTAAGTVPAPATLLLRNVGGNSGRLTITSSGSFFDASPAQLDVNPGDTASVTLTVRPSAVATAGLLQGSVTLSQGSTSLASPVILTVAPAGTNLTPGAAAGYRVKTGSPGVVFSAPAGSTPAARTLAVTLEGPAGGPALPIAASIGPGGPWLHLGSELGQPIAPGRTVTLTLTADRTHRTREESGGPVRALLRLAPVGGTPGDEAIVEVTDLEPPVLRAGIGRTPAPPPGGISFVLPTTVHGTSLTGATLSTDGWLKNEGSAGASVDVFFTPEGRSGATDVATRATTLSVPPGSTFRLSDLLTNVFQVAGTGSVEFRTLVPRALTIRSSVESVSGGDAGARFGTEIPLETWGSGIAFGSGALVVPNVSEDGASRTNLVLAETLGAPVSATITLYDAAGQRVGQPVSRTVLAFGKEQINGLVGAAAAGRSLTGGSAVVTVASGAGRLAAIGTVIDNRSGSFSALRGRFVTDAGALPASRAPGDVPLSARPDDRVEAVAGALIIPSVARVTGANNTKFTSSVALANVTATPANLTFTYHYVDVAAGNAVKTKTATATVPARGSLPAALANDVVANLFGLSTPTYGWIEIGGDAAKIVGNASISSLVDPADPAKGLKTSQVDALFSTAPEIMVADGEEHRFGGVEKSSQRRTNLILVETSGQPCRATVDVADETGAPLGSRTYDLAASQYLQINDVLGDAGVALGEGPFQNLSVRADVASGACQLVGLATVIDNQSKSPQIYVLKSAGPEGSTIGF